MWRLKLASRWPISKHCWVKRSTSALASLAYKVYVRNQRRPSHHQSQLHATLGSEAQVLYLQADICRLDLLVEIEAVGRAR